MKKTSEQWKGGTEVSQGKCVWVEDYFQNLRTWRTMEGQDNRKNRKGGNSATLWANSWFKGENSNWIFKKLCRQKVNMAVQVIYLLIAVFVNSYI